MNSEFFKKFFTTKNITLLAMLTALSIVLYLLKFPLVIFPSFLEINFSDVPILIGGFVLGPMGGAIIVIIRFLLKLPFTTTAFIGEITDLILGLSFVLPAAFIYIKKRNLKFAIIGSTVGAVCATIMGIVINRLFVIDAYVALYVGGDWDAFLSWFGMYEGITKATFYDFYLWLAVLPFNLIKFGLCAIFTCLIYKPLQNIFDRIVVQKHRAVDDNCADTATIDVRDKDKQTISSYVDTNLDTSTNNMSVVDSDTNDTSDKTNESHTSGNDVYASVDIIDKGDDGNSGDKVNTNDNSNNNDTNN